MQYALASNVLVPEIRSRHAPQAQDAGQMNGLLHRCRAGIGKVSKDSKKVQG